MYSSPSSFLNSCLRIILFEYCAPFLTSFSFYFLLVLIVVFILCSSTWSSPSSFFFSFLHRVLYHYRAPISNILRCFSRLYLPSFSYVNNRCTLYGSYTKFSFLSFLLFFFHSVPVFNLGHFASLFNFFSSLFQLCSSFQPDSLLFLIEHHLVNELISVIV